MTPEERAEYRQHKAEYQIYIWSKALVVFSIIAMVGATIVGCIHTYFINNIDKYTSYEIGSLPELFEYQDYNATVNIDLNGEVIKSALKTTIFLDTSVFLQALLCLLSLWPLVRNMDKKYEDPDNCKAKFETDLPTSITTK